jgi:hypothetical protein
MSVGLETSAATVSSGTSVLFDLLNTEKYGKAHACACCYERDPAAASTPTKV